jgi:ketopantoate hydroxymethyltransferase
VLSDADRPIGRLAGESAKLPNSDVLIRPFPREVAQVISKEISATTPGIGAESDCKGRVLVLNDLLGRTLKWQAKCARQYVHDASEIGPALSRFNVAIESGAYATDADSYHLPGELRLKLSEYIERLRGKTFS